MAAPVLKVAQFKKKKLYRDAVLVKLWLQML